MNSLQNLTELLTLSQLDPQLLDKVLAHDRWKTEAILENNLQIEELRHRYINTSHKGYETPYDQEDIDFNLASSYMECNDSQVKKLAKTKVKLGVNRAVADMWETLYTEFTSSEAFPRIPEEDRRDVRLKSLYTFFINYLLCLARVKKWPNAKDKASLSNVKKDVEDACIKYKQPTLELAYETLSNTWDRYFEGVEFCALELSEIIIKSSLKMEEKERKSDIKESPLFVKTLEKFPNLSAESLENYHTRLSGRFIEAAVKVLTLDFIRNRPKELDYTDEFAEWSDTYINHLGRYREDWQNTLKEIEIDTWDDQLKWKKESTSSQTANP